MHRAIAMLLIIFTLLWPGATQAQQPPPDLIVTLRDAQGQGVAGATISVRDAADGQEIARATTDPQGRATFPTLPIGDIRVAVQGRLTTGNALYLPGLDAGGIHVTLGAPPLWLDLRSEVDGLVRLDPAMLSVPESGELDGTAGPLAASLPEAPFATPPLGTLRPCFPAPATPQWGLPRPPRVDADIAPGVAPTSSAADGATTPAWMAGLALLLLALGGVGLLWLARKEWRLGP